MTIFLLKIIHVGESAAAEFRKFRWGFFVG